MRSIRRRIATLASAALMATAVIATGTTGANADSGDFYSPPSTLPADNGDLIRSEPSAFYVDPLKAVKADADVRRIMYRSTNDDGDPIAVTGTVIVPRAPWAGNGQRPLVGYAVGTQGLGDSCAPSKQLAAGTEYEGIFASGLLARGYAIVMTDYEGLGTPGVHTYMARASQGHAVLDSIRAAQRLDLPGIAADGPVAIAGYSQGGGASASAAELQPTYAPEIDLDGAYAGAVPANLDDVAQNLDGGLYTAFLLFAIDGVGTAEHIDFSQYLNDKGVAKVDQIKDQCVIDGLASQAFVQTNTLTKSGLKAKDMIRQQPFKAIVDDQLIGNGRAPAVPVMVGHSAFDDVIPYKTGKDLAKRWCALGAKVDFETTAVPTHVGGAVALFPREFAFLEARFAGRPTTDSCARH